MILTEENNMSIAFVVLSMVFLHIVDDFYLQGILANMKQKRWWRDHPDYKDLYRNDWLPALLAHGFSWTFMIQLPIVVYYNFRLPTGFLLMFAVNWASHCWMDHLKANVGKTNLVWDQGFHLLQVFLTAAMLIPWS